MATTLALRPIESTTRRKPGYEASPIKPRRRRRTRDELGALLDAVKTELSRWYERVSIRFLFYRLEAQHVIEKTDRAYNNLVHHLGVWRRAGEIPFSAFTDSTRWWHGVTTYDRFADALADTVTTYRRNLWRDQGVHVELWCEKDSIVPTLLTEANTFGVPVFPFRGGCSLTALHEAAETIKEHRAVGEQVRIYYFGDHDPAGVTFDRAAERHLRETFGLADIDIERVAVTPGLIATHNLPSRPTKKSDPRASSFDAESVELEAVPQNILRSIAHDCITENIDSAIWEQTQAIEAAERKTAEGVLRRWRRMA